MYDRVVIEIPSIYPERVQKLLDSLLTSDYTKYQEYFYFRIYTQGFSLEDMIKDHPYKSHIMYNDDITPVSKIDGLIPFMKIRYNTHTLCKPCQDWYNIHPGNIIYLLADDDFIFKSNTFETYYRGLEYLNLNPNCGGVYFRGFLGYSSYKKLIYPYFGSIWTNKGLMLTKLAFPTADTMDLYLGAGEDNYLAMRQVTSGKYISAVYNTPLSTTSRDYKSDSTPNVSYELSDLLSNPKATYHHINNVLKDNFGQGLWQTWDEFSSYRLPKSLINKYKELELTGEGYHQPQSTIDSYKNHEFELRGNVLKLFEKFNLN